MPQPQGPTQQMFTQAIATNRNVSLKLGVEATRLYTFSLTILCKDIQVENMRTFHSHLECALKKPGA